MTKIIKEMLPPDVRVARDTQDLLIECCVGEGFHTFFLILFWGILVPMLLFLIVSKVILVE